MLEKPGTILAEKISPRITTTRITKKTEPEIFLAGGSFDKYLIEGQIGNRDISLVAREVAEHVPTTWRKMKEAGLPVVPTLRIDPQTRERGRPTVIMTDVKADGSELYGKGLLWSLESNEARVRPRPDIDKYFLALTHSTHFNEIEKKVNEYKAVADKNHISLPKDDAFELKIKPNGAWDMLILDLDMSFHEWKENINTKPIAQFLDRLKRLRGQLLAELSDTKAK
jgi:hypothetical protein